MNPEWWCAPCDLSWKGSFVCWGCGHPGTEQRITWQNPSGPREDAVGTRLAL